MSSKEELVQYYSERLPQYKEEFEKLLGVENLLNVYIKKEDLIHLSDAGLLRGAFFWDKSPQGHWFWSDIHASLGGWDAPETI